MSEQQNDDQPSNDETATGSTESEASATENHEPEARGEGAETDKNKGSKLSHEDALKELARVRNEAATYRTRLRESEQRLSEAKSAEEFEAVRQELAERTAALEHDLLVERVARKHDLPDDLAGRLVGSTQEELEADAKKLARYAGTEEPNADTLRGGLNPHDDSDEDGLDPAELARKYGRRRRR